MQPLPFTPDPDLSYWPTPPEIADDTVWSGLAVWHVLGEGVRVLEPSAGEGHLGEAIRNRLPYAEITCVEPDPARAAVLRRLDGVANEVVEATLEDYLTTVSAAAAAGHWRPFDLVVMNPPFTLKGRREAWAEHVLAIDDHPDLLAPGAHISAIVPHVAVAGRSPLVRAVRARTVKVTPHERRLFPETFSSVGARVSTVSILIEHPYGDDVDDAGDAGDAANLVRR